MAEFLHDLNIHGAGQIQFKTTAGANAGKIDQNGNDLVLSNAVGDIIIGNGSDDVYIGDGTNAVDIRFEQNMAIYADSSSTRSLTLGGANTNLILESPTINGSMTLGTTTINNKLTFTSANGYILFDYEPSGDTGEYTTEVPLLKVDRSGEESTILARISEYRGIALGIDDTTWIRAGDTSSVVRNNVNLAEEVVLMSAESGFRAIGFPGNDTTWSNRNEFMFYSASTTASNNGLYLGDGGSTQFIDLSRNLKNIGTIDSGAIEASGVVDGAFTALRLANQKTYGSGTGINETVRFAMGISESGAGGLDQREGFVIETYTADESDSSNINTEFKVRDGGTIGTAMKFTGANKNVDFYNHVNLQDGKYLMWGGNAILQHNGTQTYIGDNSSSSAVTVTNGNITAAGSVTASNVHLDGQGDYITFYGGGETNHSITSRQLDGGTGDDIRVNTYGSFIVNLDSNNNQTSAANSSFFVGRHGSNASAIGASDLLFQIDGATGHVLPGVDAAQNLGDGSFRWGALELKSGGQIQWQNGDARIIEGLVNNYSLSFQTYDGSAVSTALRLDGNNDATFTGVVSVPTGKSFRLYNSAGSGWGELTLNETDNKIQFNRGIQPSGNGQSDQNLGISTKKWNQVHAVSYYGDGSNLTGITATDSTKLPLAGGNMSGPITMSTADDHINFDVNNAAIFDNSNNNNAYYIRNGGTNAATLQIGTGSSPGSNIKLTLDGSGNATFAGNADVSGALTLGTALAVAEGGTGLTANTTYINANSFANFASSGANWDTITTRGSYRLTGSTNNPFSSAHSTGIVITQGSGDYGIQLFSSASTDNGTGIAYRYRGTSWQNWQYLVTKTYGDGRYGKIASPTFTGTPAAPTASAGTNTTQIATTAFVSTAVSNLVDTAPENLNTLNELATALGDDANFSTTVTNSIATKLPLSGGTMTGDILMQDEILSHAGGNPELPQFRGKRSNTDLDDRQWDTEGGWSYTTFESNTTNKPSTGLHNANGLLSFNTHSGDGTNNYFHQIAMTTNTNKLWHRRRNGSGGFGSWEEIFKGSVDYSNLSGTVPTWNQNTTGSAGSVPWSGVSSKPTFVVNSALQSRSTTSPDTAGDGRGVTFNYMHGSATNKPTGTDHSLMTMGYSNHWQTQLAQDWRNSGRMYLRGQNNGTWSSWNQVWDSSDFAKADVLNSNVTLASLGAQASGNYITGTGSLSAQDLTDIGNLSGTNTGDQDLSSLAPKASPTFTGDVNITNGNVIFSSQYGVRFNDANTRIYTNTDTPEDLIIEADQDLIIAPDGQVTIAANVAVTGTVDGVDISSLPTFSTVGTAFAELGDVSVPSYIRVNADETLSYLNSTQFLTAIGGTGNTGTVTSVTAGNGMTQSGTSTVNPTLNVVGGDGITANANDIAIDYSTANANLINSATSATPSSGATILFNDSGGVNKVALSSINISHFNNNSGFTTNTGTVTAVTVGTGLDVASGTTTPNITLDLNEITKGAGLDSTATGLSLDFTEFTAFDSSSNTVDKIIGIDDESEETKINAGQFTYQTLTAHFSQSSGSSSTFNIPMNNTTESTTATYYHVWTPPFDGKVKTMIMKHAHGTFPSLVSAQPTKFRVAVNGTGADYTSSSFLTRVRVEGRNDDYYAYIKDDNINQSFSAGDRVYFQFLNSSSSVLWRNCSVSIVVEYNIT